MKYKWCYCRSGLCLPAFERDEATSASVVVVFFPRREGGGGRGKVHFLNSLLALTFWIVLQAVQDQLPDLPKREADEWTWEKRRREEDVHFFFALVYFFCHQTTSITHTHTYVILGCIKNNSSILLLMPYTVHSNRHSVYYSKMRINSDLCYCY